MILLGKKLHLHFKKNIGYGSIVDQQKDVSSFLDEKGLHAAQQHDSSRLKNKDTYFLLIKD